MVGDAGDSDPSASWRSGIVPVCGGHLAFHRTGGDGPALVLSHGLTDNGLCWSRLARALSPDFDIIMLDARGHGGSARPAAAASWDPGRDILEAIDYLGLRAPIVMGHSVGARATAEFARACPGRASKIILEDPTFLPVADPAAVALRCRKFREQVERFQALSQADIAAMGRATSPGWHDDEFPAWTVAKQQVDPDALPVFPSPWQDAVSRITEPTLLICGEESRGGIATRAIAEEARALNPLLSAVQIQGAGHNIRRENFPDFLLAVRSFLDAD